MSRVQSRRLRGRDSVRGWTCTIGGANVAEEDLLAAEWETAWLLASIVVPHEEREISPAHCPVCRSALATVVAARATDDLADAAALVAMMRASELVASFLPDVERVAV